MSALSLFFLCLHVAQKMLEQVTGGREDRSCGYVSKELLLILCFLLGLFCGCFFLKEWAFCSYRNLKKNWSTIMFLIILMIDNNLWVWFTTVNSLQSEQESHLFCSPFPAVTLQPLCVAGLGQSALQFQVRRGSTCPLPIAEPTYHVTPQDRSELSAAASEMG